MEMGLRLWDQHLALKFYNQAPSLADAIVIFTDGRHTIVSRVETLLRSQSCKADLPSKVKAVAAVIAKQQSHDPQKPKEGRS